MLPMGQGRRSSYVDTYTCSTKIVTDPTIKPVTFLLGMQSLHNISFIPKRRYMNT
uniref:Uncharacterized protein n=1 Tax=Rhizophora mucronata TaxID=61149 RepID=A0A2P2II77_RHIMU